MNKTSIRQAIFLIVILLLVTFAAAAADLPVEIPPSFTPPVTVEAWRIRIDNSVNGEVDVSIDQGRTWTLVGLVTAPATHHMTGYLAAGYAPVGTVAATAVHGIRIRVGDTSSAYPALINIIPSQFAQTPSYYGGHISGDSGIYTNIPAGVGIFRDFAPPVGSQVYYSQNGQPMRPLPVEYQPAPGDLLTIIAKTPINPLREVDFENRQGGDVTVTYADGTTSVITQVCDPVKGVGRFDGCSYTGVGAINTNHTCVITVSTAPVTTSTQLEGNGDERRGGFQIVPAWHISQTEEGGSPEFLTLGSPTAPDLEGKPPLFYGYLNLAWSLDDPDHSWVCQIKRVGDTDWQPMPTLIGLIPDAFSKLKVVAFRLVRKVGPEDTAWLASSLTGAAQAYQDSRRVAALAGGEPLMHGTENISMNGSVPIGAYAQFVVDGDMVGLTNTKPYTFAWDTTKFADGEHLVESEIYDDAGRQVADDRRLCYVDNIDALGSRSSSASATTQPAAVGTPQ